MTRYGRMIELIMIGHGARNAGIDSAGAIPDLPAGALGFSPVWPRRNPFALCDAGTAPRDLIRTLFFDFRRHYRH